MPQILKPIDVANRLAAGESAESIFIGTDGGYKAKLVGPQAEVTGTSDTERKIDFVISTEAVDRYTDIVRLGGWKTKNYIRNPIVLWAHDDSIPAIGRSTLVQVANGALCSTAEFADRDVYPLADTIYQLLKNKFIGAASVGFIPLKAKAAAGNDRPFGLDIIEQELLEWSVVNIPANPECLVSARSFGVNTAPLIGWAEKVLDQGGSLMIPRTELEALRKAAGAPSVHAVHTGADQKSVKTAPSHKVKSLWHVAWLADILMDLDCLEDCVEFEAAIEEDNSPIPQKLTDALKALGQILIDMTVEEVTELLTEEAGEDDVIVAPAPMELSAKQSRLAVLHLLSRASRPEVASALALLAPKKAGSVIDMISRALIKSGRVLSTDNEKTLRDATDHMTKAMDCVNAVVGQVIEPEDPETEAKNVRARKARALAIANSVKQPRT